MVVLGMMGLLLVAEIYQNKKMASHAQLFNYLKEKYGTTLG
jgi:hypothetical protein